MYCFQSVAGHVFIIEVSVIIICNLGLGVGVL